MVMSQSPKEGIMLLTAETVSEIFKECLAEWNNVTGSIVVEGVIHKAAFNPAKIKEKRNSILALLKELPSTFFEHDGGGWSFLNAVTNRDGHLWGEQQNAEQLMMLGMAIGRVKGLTSKEFWQDLPGGVPYYVVLNEDFPVEIYKGE